MAQYILRNLPTDLWAKLKDRATREGWPLRALLLQLVEDYVAGRVTPTEAPPPPPPGFRVRCPVCGTINYPRLSAAEVEETKGFMCGGCTQTIFLDERETEKMLRYLRGER